MNNITICHIPSGNPRNAHMITIDESALKAHLKHGDYEGECIQENISSTIHLRAQSLTHAFW